MIIHNKLVMRLAIALLLLLPVLAVGQTQDDKDKDKKVSNDDPGRPLQMPPASTEVKEALEDFERFQRRGAWERALKALYTIPEEQSHRFIDGENGFIIPVARKRHSVLAALPAQGQSAYRLFYDAEAKKLLDEAEGPSELKNLERIYSAYFVTSVGDNAADRLGDLYFEMGRFDRAADCWLAVLRERPDTDLSPALVAVKAALALARAGRKSELEQVRGELADRYGGERLTIGGQTGSPLELLRRLAGDDLPPSNGESSASQASSGSDPGPDLAPTVDALWQLRFADSVEAGMTPPEQTQWESNPLSAAVPAVAVEGSTLFANYLGHLFALDMKTGKLLWRSSSFHHLDLAAMQNQGRGTDPSRFAIVASGEHVWSLGRDLKDPNFFAPYHLACRRASTGDVVWKSSDLADYAQFDLASPPLLAGGKFFIATRGQPNPQHQNMPQQFVLAIQPHDGKILWKTEVGTYRQGQFYNFWGYMPEASSQPRLVYRAGAVYIETQSGILARLDADSGALDWGFGYRTDPVMGMGRFMIWGWGGYYPSQESGAASEPPVLNGDSFLVKGAHSDRLIALDPDRMKVQWERPIAKTSRLLGVEDRWLYLGGPELGALDLKTRELLWATRVPNGSNNGQLLLRKDGLWQLTPRGVFEVDPKSGVVRRIFRGKDLGAVGGDLLLTDRLLLAVSNRTITAYPRQPGGAAVSARETPGDMTRVSNE